MQSNTPLLRILPYAGALPFVACALLLLFGVKEIKGPGHTIGVALAYSLVIVSFMAGVHWGQFLSGLRPGVNLLVSSNAVALIAWGSYLVLAPIYECLVFVALFAFLYWIDTQLELDALYMRTRRYVTLMVCTSLLLIALS